MDKKKLTLQERLAGSANGRSAHNRGKLIAFLLALIGALRQAAGSNLFTFSGRSLRIHTTTGGVTFTVDPTTEPSHAIVAVADAPTAEETIPIHLWGILLADCKDAARSAKSETSPVGLTVSLNDVPAVMFGTASIPAQYVEDPLVMDRNGLENEITKIPKDVLATMIDAETLTNIQNFVNRDPEQIVPEAVATQTDTIPETSWYDYTWIRDFPRILWDQFRGEILSEDCQDRPQNHSLRFTITFANMEPENRELDPRQIAEFHRAWWARCFFPSKMMIRLQNFTHETTNDWNREYEKIGWPSQAKETKSISLDQFVNLVAKNSPPHSHSFDRLGRILPTIKFENLTRVNERSIVSLIDFGTTPSQLSSLLASMVLAYLRNPERYFGVAMILDDDMMPDWALGFHPAQQGFDMGRLHYSHDLGAEHGWGRAKKKAKV